MDAESSPTSTQPNQTESLQFIHLARYSVLPTGVATGVDTIRYTTSKHGNIQPPTHHHRMQIEMGEIITYL